MTEELKVPAVGESISEVTIAQWLKKDGDHVELDEVICELESDKATFELNATAAGTLTIVAQEGETLSIGGLVCKIESNGEGKPAEKAEAPKEDKAAAEAPKAETEASAKEEASEEVSSGGGEPVVMKVPTVGESISEVTIATWNKKDGDQVKQDEIICEIESDKATFELAAEVSGTLKIEAQEGETLPIGGVICSITPGAGGSKKASPSTDDTSAKAEEKQQPASPASAGASVGAVSPVAAAILSEKGINPSDVRGTGAGGKITKEDALRAAKDGVAKKEAPAAAPKKEEKAAAPTSSKGGSREQNRQKMSSLRKTISRRLVAVKNETAMLTTFNEVDMKPIMDLRSKYKDKFKEKHGVGLGFMSLFSRACAIALKEWPAVNAMIDGDEIIYNNFVDISIAVSTPKGLVVPVVRDVQDLSLAEIEKDILRLAGLARDGKLTIDQMTGGTFTITNGGVFGSMMSTPIINAPQSAILGMHNIIERPVAINGQVVIRPMMYVALSYDHRIIDGRESVSFLVRVKQLLEDPARILLDV